MEVSSQRWPTAHRAIQYAVAAFTNLTQDHSTSTPTSRTTSRPRRSCSHRRYTRFSVINTDDAYGLRIAQR